MRSNACDPDRLTKPAAWMTATAEAVIDSGSITVANNDVMSCSRLYKVIIGRRPSKQAPSTFWFARNPFSPFLNVAEPAMPGVSGRLADGLERHASRRPPGFGPVKPGEALAKLRSLKKPVSAN